MEIPTADYNADLNAVKYQLLNLVNDSIDSGCIKTGAILTA